MKRKGRVKYMEETLFSQDILENVVEETVQKPEIEIVSIQQIVANRYQPRTAFDEKELDELASSIKEHGILQPVVLRKVTSNMYEIIAGERRFRAAKLAGLAEIEAIVRNVSATEAAILALIENVQREDLSAIEEAKSYEQLMFLYSKTQTEIAEMVGISQSAVANKMRLLQLPEEIQKAIENKDLSERHGRALLRVKNKEAQVQIYHFITQNELNVADTEKYIERYLKNEELKNNQNNTIFFNVAKDTKLAVNTINKAVKTIQEFGMDVDYTKEETDDNYILHIVVPKNLVEQKEEVAILPHEKIDASAIHEELERKIAEAKQQVEVTADSLLEETAETAKDTTAIVVDLDLTSETIINRRELTNNGNNEQE